MQSSAVFLVYWAGFEFKDRGRVINLQNNFIVEGEGRSKKFKANQIISWKLKYYYDRNLAI